MRYVLVCALLLLSACGKQGFVGSLKSEFGSFAEVQLPQNCKAKQIAASEKAGGVSVLCEDGRVFH